ncbi:MAG TPA: helix-turn-helix domain-containing protein [Verrucomicrobiae bacterium]|nr:helix-turn-helix domain-containing protein [Verrucomicrobiae bacterium]
MQTKLAPTERKGEAVMELQNVYPASRISFADFDDGVMLGTFSCARRVVSIKQLAAESFARSNNTATTAAELGGDGSADDAPDAADDHAEIEVAPASPRRGLASPAQAPAPVAAAPVPAPLWTVKDAAAFLRKSPRWIFYSLQIPENEPGSIPHSKLGRNPRFIPDDLKAWASAGFPPAATFKAWQQTSSRHKKILN